MGSVVAGQSLGKIDELIRSKSLPHALFEAAQKVQKGFSVILTDPDDADNKQLHYYASHLVRKPFNRMEDMCTRPVEERLHVSINTHGHGHGAIYLTRYQSD